jgi:4-aminobutyrate aminotransferase-like enzyme
VQSETGYTIATNEFLKAIRKKCDEHCALMILDEIQNGFGRSGTFFAFEQTGVVPDILLLAKGMGGGLPIGCFISSQKLLNEFTHNPVLGNINTFGGNAVAAQAAMAVLDVIQSEGLVQNAQFVGTYLKDGFRALAGRHDCIGDVRGAGMFLGVEIVSDRAGKTPDAATTSRIVNGLRDERVLISACARSANVLKIRPQLTSTRAHADLLLEKLDLVLTRLS